VLPFADDPHAFNAFAEPLPLVVEISFRTTGDYDIAAKRPGYRERGDAEIWRLHPLRHSVTIWRRQPDGSYAESVHTSGVIELFALPGVSINLDELFEV